MRRQQPGSAQSMQRKDAPVTRDRERNSMVAMLGSLGWPLILGLSACTLFYAAIFQGLLGSEFMRRYFATHPVAFAATGMFFVGLAALLLKLGNLVDTIHGHAVDWV